ncbi:MAG: hypothetical protein HGB31_01705 [Erysipelotrichaceae bacterium]|nr:hypothetical protein [Erysipelotrichaceae bacterium]
MIKVFKNENKDHIAYPIGGLGAGMICLNGNGSLGSFSLRNKPQLKNNPNLFSAIHIRGVENGTRVLESSVPKHYYFDAENAGNGLTGTNYGLPRFESGEFSSKFPFATIKLKDKSLPINVSMVGWSPFIPNDEDHSSLPFAALEYTFTNSSDKPLDLVYSFNAFNPIKVNNDSGVRVIENGMSFYQEGTTTQPHNEAHFSVSALEHAFIDAAWFRGSWFDPLTMLWKNLSTGLILDQHHGENELSSPGSSLCIPFLLHPKERKTIIILMTWYVPISEVRTGETVKQFKAKDYYQPWYTSLFDNATDTHQTWIKEFDILKKETLAFTRAFYRSTLDPLLLEAVSANLSILKSPTILRQKDGRLWAWEGCCDHWGCCDGSCTHVWNYAQSISLLFPTLERGLRETEFTVHQDSITGHQNFRVLLPIRPPLHHGHSAADGQLGGIIKMYREWKISGDTAWMYKLYPEVKRSLDFAIEQWDPNHIGLIVEPHHNTYDIEFWGAEPMNSGFYLGALMAFVEMSKALSLPHELYLSLYKRGRKEFESLFNGEYFFQKTQWTGLRSTLDIKDENSETKALIRLEGPKYQYGNGCLSDALIGIWLSELAGLHDLIDESKLKSTLNSIVQYNYKASLLNHCNPQRPGFACADESGLLLCTWPHGDKPSLPFVYSDELWTGIEYQVASHLMMKGNYESGRMLVQSIRRRYDGKIRNPFSEYECGQWYARAMSSYALLYAASGVRYDGLTQTLTVRKTLKEEVYFICTPTGFGTISIKGADSTVKPYFGTMNIKKINVLGI